MALAAQAHIDIQAGQERAVAATKSYTAELLALYLPFGRVRGGDATAAEELSDLGEQLSVRMPMSPSWPSATGSPRG